MKQWKQLLLLGTLATCTFGITLVANKSLNEQLDKTEQQLASLDNEMQALMKQADKLTQKKVHLSQNDTNRSYFNMRRKAVRKAPIVIKKDNKEASPISIKKDDFELKINGKTKIEHMLKKNDNLLNSNLPDTAEYFKNSFDVMFNLSYGEQKFGHKAVEAFADLYHKGVWGRGAVFADSDGTSPAGVQLSDTVFGEHNHTNGKPLVWLKEAWLKFSINAALGQKNAQNIHTIKLGWFPFALGRGIALGSCYGLNRELLGLYNYTEDKGAPGLNIHGDIIKDYLSYDLYYSKFEERNKNLKDTLNIIKANHLHEGPWRGVAKDDELFAGSVTWNALKGSKIGDVTINPYIFYNEASDQRVELLADTKTELGTGGLTLEHKWNNFEWGGEVAFNFGDERLKAIDRNVNMITRNSDDASRVNGVPAGTLVEQYSHLALLDPNTLGPNLTPAARVNASGNPILAAVNENSKAASARLTENGQHDGTYINLANRYRCSFKNELRGWMGVVDAAYTFENMNLSVAAAYGYASGDDNPHEKETNKRYKGFIGLHEQYCGKRVASILVLGERYIQTPSSLHTGDTKAKADLSFSDLQHFGFGATWKPCCLKHRNFSVNPNAMFFWKANTSKKFDAEAGVATDCDASKFMGTELNLVTKFELIKNLNFFGNFAVFLPGSYFKDIKGVPMDKDFFALLQKTRGNLTRGGVDPLADARTFRISDNTAYLMNVGLEYKF